MLVLVETYFSRQEQEHLRERSDEIAPTLESAFDEGISREELQQIASFSLFTGRVRIRVMDRFNQLLIDSGNFDDKATEAFLAERREPFAAYEFYLDDNGRLRGFGFPEEDPFAIEPFLSEREFGFRDVYPRATIEPVPLQPVTEISEAAFTFPIQVDDQVVGYAQLSEGPAFGKVIRQSIQRSLLISGIIALVFAAGAAVLFARQVTRPLSSLGRAADEMAQGNLKVRAKGSKISEVDRLSTQFNDMVRKLSLTIESLEKDRAWLRRFIADASHEIRTPLTALITFNSLLARSPDVSEEPTSTFISESDKQLGLLDRLTTDLLDLSRYEARLSGTDFVLADIRPTVAQTAENLKPISQAKNQHLELIMPPDKLSIRHDPASIECCLGNIIINAINQTSEEGRIQINLKKDSDWVTISVLDNGPGIPEEKQSRIFDRFFRGSRSEGEGSGLGLAIAQEIAAIHGGSIKLISREGQGSQFTLQLAADDEQGVKS
jgi:signal transduction histidine kinase